MFDIFWSLIWAAFIDDNEWWIEAEQRRLALAETPNQGVARW